MFGLNALRAGLDIRRPKSRKIRLAPAALLDLESRRRLTARLADARPGQGLAQALLFLAEVYGGETDAAEARLAKLTGLSELLVRTDLWKFLILCFRDHAVGGGGLSREQAALLFRFSEKFDPRLSALSEGAPKTAPVPALSFPKAPLSSRLKVTICCRKYYFGGNSRLHDIGARFKSAFAASGIDAHLFDPSHDPDEIRPSDLVLVDDASLFIKDGAKKAEFLEKARKAAGTLAAIELDPWMKRFKDRMEQAASLYDLIWTPAPSLLDRDGKIYGRPASVAPFPVGFPDSFARIGEPVGDIAFAGGLEDYNFHRYFWMLAGYGFRNPFRFALSTHKPDGLSIAASLEDYLTKLLSAYACLNFTMRGDGSRIVPGRSFDVPAGGRLLVQESAPEMSAYFRPGAEFVEFSTLAELEEICFRLKDRAQFEPIRKAGIAKFAADYADRPLLEHLGSYLT